MNKSLREAALLLCLVLAGGCSPSPGGAAQGSAAPDFTLPVYEAPSQVVTLSQIHGENPVLLVFWASWCPSCVEEIPQLNTWQKSLGPLGLKIYGVNVGESVQDIRDFVKRQPIHYPILLDTESRVADQYGLVGLPAAVLLAKGGKILYYGFSLPPDPGGLVE